MTGKQYGGERTLSHKELHKYSNSSGNFAPTKYCKKHMQTLHKAPHAKQKRHVKYRVVSHSKRTNIVVKKIFPAAVVVGLIHHYNSTSFPPIVKASRG